MFIDLNCDMGESFGAYTLGADNQMLPLVTSANIAAGFHAGDPQVLDRTVALAVGHGVAIGAHPGFPDLVGFGRRNLTCTPEEVEAFVLYQVAAVAGFAISHGAALTHVKPHGALYNMAARRPGPGAGHRPRGGALRPRPDARGPERVAGDGCGGGQRRATLHPGSLPRPALQRRWHIGRAPHPRRGDPRARPGGCAGCEHCQRRRGDRSRWNARAHRCADPLPARR